MDYSIENELLLKPHKSFSRYLSAFSKTTDCERIRMGGIRIQESLYMLVLCPTGLSHTNGKNIFAEVRYA